ncbi:MAG: M23 family metallopeptidase [bacterium]
MPFKRNLTFLYMPDDHSRVRQVRVPRLAFLLSCLALGCLLTMCALFLVGVWQGASWFPGGSVLLRENTRLVSQIGRLEQKIAVLRGDLAEVYRVQEMVSLAAGIDPLDPNVWEAGVGGRTPLTVSLSGLSPDAEPGQIALLEQELDKMLRQARIQHEGYLAMLDTLAGRGAARQHLPSIRPVDIGWLSSGFGKRPDPFTAKHSFHHGIDFSIPNGTPIRATAAGIVTAVKQVRGFGRLVQIDHGNRIETLYAHLSQPLVKKGQQVERGDIIAESGQTGRVTAPHLHYEVRVNGRRVNPLPFILDSYATR